MRRWTYRELRNEVERRGMRLNRIAALAGYTQPDFSRLLSLDPDGIAAEDTARRVLEAIDKLARGVAVEA